MKTINTYIIERLKLSQKHIKKNNIDVITEQWQASIISDICFCFCKEEEIEDYEKFINDNYSDDDLNKLFYEIYDGLNNLSYDANIFLKDESGYTKKQIEWAKLLFSKLSNNYDLFSENDTEQVLISILRGFEDYDNWKL